MRGRGTRPAAPLLGGLTVRLLKRRPPGAARIPSKTGKCPDDLHGLGGHHTDQRGEHDAQRAHRHTAGGCDIRIDGSEQQRSVARREHRDDQQANQRQHGQPRVAHPHDLAE